jgi:hypothetical protein
MDLICPECMGAMATIDGENARCTVHGGTYKILYTREQFQSGSTGGIDPPAYIAGGAGVPSTGVMCHLHPQVQAVHSCHECHVPICATCDFAYPGGIHLCPACASKPQSKIGPRRRKTLIWSYVMAVWVTFCTAVLFSGVLRGMIHSQEDTEALGYVMILFVYIPSLVGTGTAFGSKDRRLGNPPVIWISIIWNSLLLAILLLLMIVGLMK